MGKLEDAIALAAKAHAGQVDKAGAPYILHPLRVMLAMNTEEERITAVLHDVVEDAGITLERLRSEGFSTNIVDAVNSVTGRPGEDYESFVLRAASNSIGRTVKLADLQDNCDLARIQRPTERDHIRIMKYRKAISLIENAAKLRASSTELPRTGHQSGDING